MQAVYRLLAQPIVDGDNIAPRAGNLMCELFERPFFWKSKKDLGTRNGITLFYGNTGGSERPTIVLQVEGSIVGYLNLHNFSYNQLIANHDIDGVYIKEEYRNKGLGTIMYLAALKECKSICSSSNLGSLAIRTWRSLEKYGVEVKLFNLDLKKEVPFTWNSIGMPEVDGINISKTRSEYVFFAHKNW